MALVANLVEVAKGGGHAVVQVCASEPVMNGFHH